MSIPSRASRPAHLATLTSVRFFAALAVLLYHYDFYDSGWALAHPVFAQGYVGVSLFFVLSGFILAYTYSDRVERGELKWGAFLKARVARIYPLYVVALVIGLVQQLTIPRPEGIDMLATSPLLTLLLNLTLLQNWVPPSATAINGPGWSIACEAGFYLAFPILAAIALRASEKRVLKLCVATSIVWFLIPTITVNTALHFVASSPPSHKDVPTAMFVGGYMLSITRLFEFMIGILAYRAFQLGSGALWRSAGVLAGAAAVAVFIGHNLRRLQVPGTSHQAITPRLPEILIPLAFAALIVFLALRGGDRPRWLAHPALVFGGKISFAMYLVHMPIFYIALKLGTDAGQPVQATVGASILTIASASAAHLFIEEPARRWILGLRRRPSALPTDDPALDKGEARPAIL